MNRNVEWLEEHSAASLRRLLPRIEARFKAQTDAVEWDAYVARLKHHFPRLFVHLHALNVSDRQVNVVSNHFIEMSFVTALHKRRIINVSMLISTVKRI